MKKGILRKFLMAPSRKLLALHTGAEAHNYMAALIEKGEPFMAARFGAVEIKAMLYCRLPWPMNLAFRRWAFHDMAMNAGFFPPTKANLRRFTKLMLQSIESLDVLASWRIEELFFKRRLKHAFKVPLGIMGPIYPPPPMHMV